MLRRSVGYEDGHGNTVYDVMISPQTLFAYGTLIDAATRDEILGHRVDVIDARVVGYERRRSRYHYLARKAGAVTGGVILMGLTAGDFRILDEYEEVPHLYTREFIEAETSNGVERCWVYMATAALIS